MGNPPIIFVLLYFTAVIGIGIYLLLAREFVSAHKRGAAALERIANKIGTPEPKESVSVLDRRP